MAKEIKSFKCKPQYEQAVMEYRQKCGWEFVSTQEIYNKDTHLEGGIFTDSVTSVTETMHYVKLTFQRDSADVKPEILDLERKIDNLHAPDEPRTFGILALCLAFVCYIIPGIILLRINNKRKKEYEEKYAVYSDELDRLLAQLDALQ